MHRMVCCLLLTLGTMAGAQAPQATSAPGATAISPVVVLTAEDVKHPPRVERVRKAFQQVAAALNLLHRELPHVVVMYVARADADTQSVPRTVSIAVEAGVSPGTPLYHVWIVDDVRDAATVEGLVMVMNDNFQLKLQPASVRETRDRVCRELAGTVDYHALAEGK